MQPNILWICTDQQRYDTIDALAQAVDIGPKQVAQF